MSAQIANEKPRDQSAAIILGAVLGMIFAGAVAASVGGWQLWRASAGAATFPSPYELSDDVQYFPASEAATLQAPAGNNSGYSTSSPYGAPAQQGNPATWEPTLAPKPEAADSEPGESK
jgi:hypothetical protein